MEFGDRSYMPRTIVGKGQKRREIYWPLAASKAVYAYRMGERALALDNLIARVCSGALALKDTFLEKAINQATRSEEHTSELQSLMRISYAVFCLKKKK